MEFVEGLLKNVLNRGKPDKAASITDRLRSLDVVNDSGTTPLHSAIKRGNENVVKFAINSGSNINVKDRSGTTPLLTSILYNRFDITKLLLEANAEIDHINKNGKSALQVALNVKRKVPIEVIRYFYDSFKSNGLRSEEIARKFSVAGSSLVSAIHMDDSEMTRAILESKESIYNDESCKSVRAAMRNGSFENVRVLLQYGPNVTDRKSVFNDELGLSITHALPDVGFAKPFVDKMIDWDIIDERYVKFLEDVFRSARHEAIEVFLDNKIDVYVKEKFGVNLFLYLCGNANPGIVKILRSRKFDVAERNFNGKSALHLAVIAYAIENIRYLLVEGADPNAKDFNGVTPLHEASGEPKFVELLLRGGADVQATDARGRTVFEIPTYWEAVELMLAHLAIVEGQGTPIKKEVRDAIQSREKMKTTYESLCGQIDEMKNCKIFRSFNLFMVLTQKPENIVSSVRSRSILFNNLNYCQDRQWHRYYMSTMTNDLSTALEIIDLRGKAARTVQKCVNHLVHLNCDHLALETIVRFLCHDDLRALA